MGRTASGLEVAVRVRLFADLRRHLPRGSDGPLEFRLAAGSKVQDLLDAIGIAHDAEVTAGIGGELATRETVLKERDEIVLFSPMEGGGDTSRYTRSPRTGRVKEGSTR
jgi:molybdopterin converting factor small subunit